MKQRWPKGRTRYRGLMSLPARGLYRNDKLVASVRAEKNEDALYIFKVHGIAKRGDKVRKIQDAS